ncbi:MAG TPA: glycosyltransferase, partial [Candidatus Brocadiaceae bacterium]
MKNVLMIAYYFPPALTAGTFRTFRFVKYLPENGWKPLILTLNSNNYNKKEVDFNLLGGIPIDAEIFRTPALLVHQKYTNLRMVLNKRKNKSDSIGLSDKYGTKAGENNDTLVRKVKLFIDEVLRIPDVDVGWIPFATLKALRLIYSKQIDLIYTSGGPFGTLVVGLILKKITGKPWVVDFRDPFSQNQSITYNVFKGIRRYLEKAILRNADRVIAVTDWLKKSFLECHPEIPEDKVMTITNGFDPGDFKDIKPSVNCKFTIGYIGSMYGLHSPAPFLQGLSLLCKESPALEKKMDVAFIGPGGDEYKHLVKDLKLADIVRFLGTVSHRDALQWMVSSNLLLVTLTG